MAERRGTLAPAEISESLVKIEASRHQSIDYATEEFPVRRLLATAAQFHLTAYDAEYPETTRAQQLPLALLDRRLRAAAVQAGLDLVP